MSPNAVGNTETVGKAALHLLAKGDQKQGVIDTQREMQKNYIDELIKCAQRGASMFGIEKPFYVCVQNRRERLLENVFRCQFYPRRSRPLPAFDLSLYHYDPKAEKLTFVWTIPDEETFKNMIEPGYISPKGEEQLYGFVKAFHEGRLI
jgi:hypothetical protein